MLLTIITLYKKQEVLKGKNRKVCGDSFILFIFGSLFLFRLLAQHKLYFAYTKHLWATDRRDEAIHRLGLLCNVVGKYLNTESKQSMNCDLIFFHHLINKICHPIVVLGKKTSILFA